MIQVSSSFSPYLYLSCGCSVQVHPIQPPSSFPKTPAPGVLQEELPPHKPPTLPLDQVGQLKPSHVLPCRWGRKLVGPVQLGICCTGGFQLYGGLVPPTPHFSLEVIVSAGTGTFQEGCLVLQALGKQRPRASCNGSLVGLFRVTTCASSGSPQ